MPNKCQLTGKKMATGNSRSHSNIASKRTFKVNLQKRRLLNPATKKYLTLMLSTKAIKTLKKWDKEGKRYDLAKLVTSKA
ncbi:50S ribosomal protein L28 [Candidatus Falkowbacteria bacterium RIFOXYC2_FULL_47_12]|uniref:Large ribosomal subunit protein bL28 n=2 Tax=Candidatus Falkowiibacteriota TaxID=1752728 RepID=A0A1F5TQM3_9BACT|nr:MAG: 50S ribosomal protein L28 [Candidatus Falkowbacteria bacterium RIFOXYA2_FULL_47_9]OGF41260.1 MAG: 50S ribosomal protein L28 [Candidatus Falkowbacteria bacterium RIFOXYC2_FULL_47_12]